MGFLIFYPLSSLIYFPFFDFLFFIFYFFVMGFLLCLQAEAAAVLQLLQCWDCWVWCVAEKVRCEAWGERERERKASSELHKNKNCSSGSASLCEVTWWLKTNKNISNWIKWYFETVRPPCISGRMSILSPSTSPNLPPIPLYLMHNKMVLMRKILIKSRYYYYYYHLFFCGDFVWWPCYWLCTEILIPF